MKEDGDIATYFLWVDEIVNTMRGLGEKVENPTLVQKILISLPMRFDSKVSSLEERQDLDKISMDELHGILTAYDMRIEQEKPSRKEEAIKVSKKTKKNNQNPKSCSCSSCSEDSDDEEEANFVIKLNRGTDKFKGKLPFKCFNCGKIGHFASKCPYAKGSKSDEEKEEPKKENKHQKILKGQFLKKKNIYSKEDSSSSDEDDSDSESRKVLFMAFEENIENNEDNYEEEGTMRKKIIVRKKITVKIFCSRETMTMFY